MHLGAHKASSAQLSADYLVEIFLGTVRLKYGKDTWLSETGAEL